MDQRDVFISYNSQDREAALELDEQLRTRGFQTWIDSRDAVPGQRWIHQLEGIIEAASAVLVLVGGSGLGPWESLEVDGALQQAVDRDVPVIPVFLKEAPPEVGPKSLLLFLRARVAVDLRTESLDRLAEGLGIPVVGKDGREQTVLTRTLLARLDEVEVDRLDEVRGVAARLRPGQAIVVLTPRRTGSTSFTRQLQLHLREIHPDWDVPAVTVQPLAGEDERGYVERMRDLLGVDSEGGPIVACLHGWSRGTDFEKLDPYHAKLGGELRALLESALLEGAGRRPFSIVAAGSYPLFLLRYGPADMSWLNIAKEQPLPGGLSPEQVFELMEKVDSGRWSTLDAGEACRLCGGHPLLVKKLLGSWLGSPGMGWAEADRALEDERDFLLPTLARVMARPRLRRELERCCQSEDGVRIDSLNALAPEHYLYYEGLLRRDGRRWKPRCDAVRRLVLEATDVRGGDS